jgi:hypothetical protein
MTSTLLKALRVACGLLFAAGLVLTVTAMIAARHWPFSYELAMGGIVVCFSATAIVAFGPVKAALTTMTCNLPTGLRVLWRLLAAAGLVLIATFLMGAFGLPFPSEAHLGILTGIVICFFSTAILASNLSRALRIACGLLAAGGLLLIATPFISAGALEDHDPAPAIAGMVVCFIATAFYLLSRCKAAQQPSAHPGVASLLGLAAILVGTVAVCGLYMCIYAYLWPWHWLGHA